MNITPQALRKLASLSLSSEQMSAVLEIIADGYEIEQERKKKQAERKRKSRSMSQDSHAHVTGQSQDTPLDGFNGFPHPSLTSLNPTKENPPKGGQKKNPQVIPSWMPLAEWEAFKQMRLKIKKPMTAHAEDLAISKLDRFRMGGHDPTEILNQSILNNYQDLFEPRKQHANSDYKSKESNTTSSLRALHRAGNRAGSSGENRSGEFLSDGQEIPLVKAAIT